MKQTTKFFRKQLARAQSTKEILRRKLVLGKEKEVGGRKKKKDTKRKRLWSRKGYSHKIRYSKRKTLTT